MSDERFPYVWAWGPGKVGRLPGRKGKACRVIVRGSRNSCLIEFEDDGAQFVTSRNGLRRIKPAKPQKASTPLQA